MKQVPEEVSMVGRQMEQGQRQVPKEANMIGRQRIAMLMKVAKTVRDEAEENRRKETI